MGSAYVQCSPVVGRERHTLCAECVSREVARTCSVDVDFETLSMRRGMLVCPFAINLRAWRTVLDLHDAGVLCNLASGGFADSDPVSSLMASFEEFEFEMQRVVAMEALAACGCSAIPFSDRAIATALPDDAAYAAYMRARHRVRDNEILAEAQAEVERCARELRAAYEQKRAFNFHNALLSRQLKNQMPKARQCGRCGFGPVDHFACGDLRAHQGQHVGRARVDNSCPACKWFSPELRDWPEWDGELTPWLEETVDFAPVSAPRGGEPAPAAATEPARTGPAEGAPHEPAPACAPDAR
ncbi:hypothetical protein KFE25_009298 [Diacronema lutheri]|uniref:Uncharacterized protein n=1 Tax=Diacronema lutheri TaxID=2081491 RepID=A0A8J5XY30_DIALT|nr:hypothetical protein KFE25_009298 [Diacronema lutheri]